MSALCISVFDFFFDSVDKPVPVNVHASASRIHLSYDVEDSIIPHLDRVDVFAVSRPSARTSETAMLYSGRQRRHISITPHATVVVLS